MAKNWFAYDGVGNPNLPASYTRMTLAPNCTSGVNICAIYLNDESLGNPGSLADVQDYISNALATLIPQPQDGATKRFVYLKSV
ncbi:hypothetical protein [Pedobacter gandavensis]|uniref:hypothetical protein n=1 Tax=Pedobacter gandavensis TaxID=2679963 RepID=UPI00293003F5|nr:hypothetical protein [Pedobacter gandavensis]